ncbi:MAG: hypothetical protein LBK05_08995, partial [Treponema sp.]|nr:hypothetical protein [Treponema sp.]
MAGAGNGAGRGRLAGGRGGREGGKGGKTEKQGGSAIPSYKGLTPFPASSGGSPSSISDQYRSPQICPALPSIPLNRCA